MAGPTTAALDDDIREIRSDIKALTASVARLEVEMARRFEHLETKLDQRSLFGSWMATALAPALLALFGTVVAGAWYAGSRFATLDVKVSQLEQQPKLEIEKP
jgi:hypothetical protein